MNISIFGLDNINCYLKTLSREYERRFLERCVEYHHPKFTMAHYPIINALSNSTYPINQAELSSIVGTTPQSTGARVIELIKAEYVQKKRDPKRKNSSQVSLTKHGFSLVDDLKQIIQEVEEHFIPVNIRPDFEKILQMANIKLQIF